MTLTVEAIFKGGQLHLLEALSLPEDTRVHVRLDSVELDVERTEWLAQGERNLLRVWGNQADDVYNELLTQ